MQGFRKTAASFQQPRNLDMYRDYFGRSRANKEGYLEVKCTSRGENPNALEWERKFVVFQDGILSWSETDGREELIERVRLEDVLSVKTARAVHSRAIIALTTEGGLTYYMHAQSEEDMKDWLFCFHLAVISYFVGVEDTESTASTRRTTPTLLGRQGLAGRSNSGDVELSRHWPSGSSNLDSIETVDMVEGHQSEANTLTRIPTRDVCFLPLSPDAARSMSLSSASPPHAPRMSTTTPPLHPRTPSGSSSVSSSHMYNTVGSPHVTARPPGFDHGYSPSRSPGFLSPHRRPSSYREVATESTKRLVEPPVELDLPATSVASPHTSSSSSTSSSSPRSPKLVGFQGVGLEPKTGALHLGIGSVAKNSQALHQQGDSGMLQEQLKEEEEEVEGEEEEGETESSIRFTRSGKQAYVPPHLRKDFVVSADDMPPMEDEEESDARDIQRKSSNGRNGSGVTNRAMYGSFGRSLSVNSDGGEFYDDGELFQMESVGLGGVAGIGGAGHRGFAREESEVSSSSSYSSNMLYGRTAEQGCRASMEDFDVAFPSLMGQPMGFYGVFDGHCGTRVAELASKKLHEYCLEAEGFFDDWPHGAQAALGQAFQRVEEEFFEMATTSKPPMQDGSCAIVALVHYPNGETMRADSILVGNLGDSRAVLYHGGEIRPLSREHSPARPEERERIEGIGGWVTIEREMLIEKLHRMDLNDPQIRMQVTKRFNYVETSRVNGELAVSRALGDIDYKKPAQDNYQWFFPTDHEAYGQSKYTFASNLVDSTPEWQTATLDEVPGADPRSFLVIACDGLWDALTNEEAVEICRECSSPQEASNKLVDYALRMGTSDNVTVLVVSLSEGTFS